MLMCMHEGKMRQVFARYFAVNVYLRERERIFKFKWDLVRAPPSKFARGNVAAGTANRVCQLFQPRRVSVTVPDSRSRGLGRIPWAAAHSWAGSRRGCIDFSLVRCAGEMQLRPRMHLSSLLARLANIFSSSTSSPLRFRILRQAEELKCSPENVGNKKHCLFDYRLWHKRDIAWENRN